MAKGRRRKFRRYLRGQLDMSIALGTLGSRVVISDVPADSVIEKAWLSSVKAWHAMTGFSPEAADGPILVGVAHSDYTSAEIEEWIESIDSWEETDLIGQEVAKRKIRRIGIFHIPPSADAIDVQTLNDGKHITTKCGWMLSTGQSVRFWAYNLGQAPLSTGALMKVQGHANLWPA